MRETILALTQRQAGELREARPQLVELLVDAARIWPVAILELDNIGRTWSEERAIRRKIAEAQGLENPSAEVLERLTSGIHADSSSGWRAADGKIRTFGDDYQVRAEAVADVLNLAWDYDPGRPDGPRVALATLHGTGAHIHFQTHPNTRRRPGVSRPTA